MRQIIPILLAVTTDIKWCQTF